MLVTTGNIDTLGSIQSDVKQYQRLMGEVEENISEREEALTRLETSVTAYLDDAQRIQGPLKSARITEEEKAQINKALDTYVENFQAVVALTDSGSRLSDEMVSTARSAIESADRLRTRQYDNTEPDRQQSSGLILGATGIAVVLGILMASMITRAIVSPINQAVAAASEIASGNLTVDISATGTNEIGRLMAALATMVTNLQELVRSIESGASNIAASAEELSTVTSQTSDGINRQKQIATAAEQQTSVAEEISQNVTSFRDITDQSAASSNQTAISSNELARLGSELQSLVSGFRL